MIEQTNFYVFVSLFSELIRQMRRLVGGEDVLSESSAVFYLEMSNWNVASAVGHYFDLQVRLSNWKIVLFNQIKQLNIL